MKHILTQEEMDRLYRSWLETSKEEPGEPDYNAPTQSERDEALAREYRKK